MTEIDAWIGEIRARRDMVVREISLNDCDPWELVDGSVERPDYRFFRIVGVSGSEPESVRIFIDQSEVGVLAFLFTRIDGRVHVLCQAKDEPGNEGITQVAPTIQATRSNFELAHGGTAVPYFAFVSDDSASADVINDCLLSEHGERFWGKSNRNLSMSVTETVKPHSSRYEWFPLADLCAEMDTDFLVNTDARSVLSSAPWAELVDSGRLPFDGESEWHRSLQRSFLSDATEGDVRDATGPLVTARQELSEQSRLAPLTANRLTDSNASEWLTFLDVSSATREVGHWRQPIYVARDDETNFLLLARRQGELVAILRLADERGLTNGVEWSVTGTGRHTAAVISQLHDSGRVVARVRQTEEGSRFNRCLSHSELVVTDSEIDPEALAVEGYCAVTLGALNQLACTSGCTTNELRTAMSLLLGWL
jgi:oxidase EvaA